MIELVKQFFLIGAGTFGGGLAMIPIFLDIVTHYNWLSEAGFTDLVSISQATPGPIAINMATFMGYTTHGILGAVIASLVLVMPGYLISISLGRVLEKYKNTKRVIGMMTVLKCVITGLLIQALIFMGGKTFFADSGLSIKAILMFVFAIIISSRTKLNLAVQIIIFGGLGVIIL